MSSILDLLKALLAALLYWAGKRAGKAEIETEQAKEAAEKQKEYAEIASDGRTDETTIGRMGDGTF